MDSQNIKSKTPTITSLIYPSVPIFNNVSRVKLINSKLAQKKLSANTN